MINFSFFGLYFLRINKIKCVGFISLALGLFFSFGAQAATYNLTSGQYPPCSTSWNVSGTSYTCNGNGLVTLASGDVLTSNTTITIFANNGFSLTNNTIGTSTNSINLTSSYGNVVSAGTNTLYGFIQGGSGGITLVNTTVSGAITTSANINLTGGSVAGLVTSSANTITTNNTNLTGGARAQSGMSISGGNLAGAFTMTSANAATFTNVVMASGSISGASTVSITGSAIGSSTASVSVASTSGAVSLSSTTVYGSLTAPNYSTINVSSGSMVTGTCSPNSTPSNACNAAPVCTTGLIGGLTGNYYNNLSLTGSPTGTRIDSSVNFDWSTGAPGVTGIPADVFSIRWTGSLRAPSTGAFQFQTQSDDGVRLWINNVLIIDNWSDHSTATNTSAVVNLVAGQSYPVRLEFYENGGSAIIKLLWSQPTDSTFTVIGTQAGVVPNTSSYCEVPTPSCNGFIGGASGKYYNNVNLTGSPTNRIDSTIDFTWGGAAPGVTGIGADNFSVRWDSVIKVTATGNYQFDTVSDDGVRLWVNNVLVIDNWTYHGTTTNVSPVIPLTAGTNYPIRVEYFEGGGSATMQVHWKKPADSGYTTINACPSALVGYTVSSSPIAVTCAGEPVTFTAVDGAGTPFAPTAGTGVTLSSAASGVWVGGNAYSFNGTATSFTRYLQQTTPANLTLGITDSINTGSGSISFVDSALKFYSDATGSVASATMINQVAGVPTGASGNTPILKAIRTDDATGACVAQITGTKSVNLAYECVNPTTCIAGQTFTINGVPIKANPKNATITYLAQNLTFDATGAANIPLKYTDVGQVTLYAQTTLPATTNDPAKVLGGVSNSFVVRPHTLAVLASAVKNSADVANLGTTNSGAGFAAAGESFKVSMEVRNAEGNLTPNFGNETASERTKLTLAIKSLVYPTGGATTALSNSGTFNATTPAGTFVNTGISWNQVGSITLLPGWSGTSYLGSSAPTNMVASGTVGRFYPDHYRLLNGSLASACTGFTYMSQPMSMSYRFQAEALNGSTALENYDNFNQAQPYAPTSVLGPNMAQPSYQAENDDLGNGSSLNARVIVPAFSWDNGVLNVSTTNAIFSRLSNPEAPLLKVQIGVGLADTLDGRLIQSPNMNSLTAPACVGAGCTAIMLGSQTEYRYGRLRLDDAFGPETLALPVNFYTEYWVGNHFTLNAQDSCTVVPRTAITYPAGTLASDANRTVPLTGGTTLGTYNNLDATGVRFNAGVAGQAFSAPTGAAQGRFVVGIDLTNLPWLRFDWNQDGNHSDLKLPNANFTFGSYRGNDRIIYWRERLQ